MLHPYFFDNVFKLEEFDVLVIFHNSLCNYFGSTRHCPEAMLKKNSKDNNNDIHLGFIKIEDTRMGGNIISLLRLLRLRDPLAIEIHSNEFRKLNVRWEFCSLLLRGELW